MIGGAATHRQIQGVNVNLFLESSEDPDKKSTNEQILESCGKIDKKKCIAKTKRQVLLGTSLEEVGIQSTNTVGEILVDWHKEDLKTNIWFY